MSQKKNEKVFGIGFHRTGTKSLQVALEMLGIPSAHYYLKEIYESPNIANKWNFNESFFNQFDGFTDNPTPFIFQKLDQLFPNSKFILTIRPIEDWLKSIQFLFQLNQDKWSDWDKACHKILYGNNTAPFNVENAKVQYLKHIREVKNYFSKRVEQLLIIDFEKETDHWKPLCQFLNKPIPLQAFPWLHQSPQGMLRQKRCHQSKITNKPIHKGAIVSEVKCKILAIADGGVPTGLARVATAILKSLHSEFDIHQLATNYNGDPHDLAWKLYPSESSKNQYGFHRVNELIQKVEPDIIFIYNDPWIQNEYLNILKKAQFKGKIITYTPVETGPIDPEWFIHFDVVHAATFFTEFGKNQFLTICKNIPQIVSAIPHGVDTTTFFPLSQPQSAKWDDAQKSILEAKSHIGIGKSTPEDTFIVLNANRNQPRKRIDVTIEGFSLFAKDKPPGVKLYLHMGLEDQGWNVLKLSSRHGIEDRLLLTHNDNTIPGISDRNLNLLYNACDVGVNTSTCEGWGLPSFEHAATFKPQIISGSPNQAEIWNGSAYLLSSERRIVHEKTLFEGILVSPQELANELEHLYSDIEYRQKRAELCYQNATRSAYSWNTINEQWKEIFISTLKL